MTRQGDNSTSPNNTLTNTRRVDEAWAAVAMFGTTISVAVAIAYCVLRLGLFTPPLLPLACVLIVAATLFGPLVMPYRGWLAEPRYRGAILPLVSFAILGSVVAALWLGAFLLVFYVLLATAGLARAGFLLRSRKIGSTLALMGFGLVLAVYLFLTVHSLGLAGVYSPEEAFLGILNHDTTIHSAIAYMIQNFGAPSIGLDGILLVRYHFGSHVWYAALGTMTAAEPVWSYGAAVPIVGAPLLLASLIVSAVAMDGARRAVASYILVGSAILLLSDAIGWNSYYISESYTFGLIGLLLLLPLLAEFARVGPIDRFTVAGLAVAVAIIPVLMLLKTSIGILWCAAFGWVVLRRFGVSKITIITGIAAAVALVGILSLVSPGVEDYRRSDGADLSVRPFFMFIRFPGVITYSSLILPICLVLLRITGRGGESLRSKVYGRSDLMLEAVIVVTVLGAIPPLIGVPQDSAVWYFFNVAQWIAMALLIIQLAPNDPMRLAADLRTSRLFAPALVVIAYIFLASSQELYTRTTEVMNNVVATADQVTDGTLLAGRTPNRYFFQNLITQGTVWGPDFREALASSVGAQVRQVVHDLAGVPTRNLAVFIPPKNTDFWTLHTGCLEKHNVQAALTGQPSLFGGIPESYECPRDAYVSAYGEGYQSRDGLADAELCTHAAERSIGRVLILAESRSSGKNRILDCPVS